MKYLRYTLFINQQMRSLKQGNEVEQIVARAWQSSRSPIADPLIVKVEAFRAKLLSSHTAVVMEEYGAGSAALKQGADQPTKTVVISGVAKAASTTPARGSLLYHLITLLQPSLCLELGTCLGVSAGYMLAALPPGGYLFTLEGATELAKRAAANLDTLDKPCFTVVTGRFQDTLPELLVQPRRFQFAFIDGHHNGPATLAYFDQLLPFLDTRACLVFDDIHWSMDMQQAWQQLRKHPAVWVSIDLFSWGILFLR